jgi:hypothetical protein
MTGFAAGRSRVGRCPFRVAPRIVQEWRGPGWPDQGGAVILATCAPAGQQGIPGPRPVRLPEGAHGGTPLGRMAGEP